MTLKRRLLLTCIFSIIAYASETWTYKKNIMKRISAFEVWCYRRILKITWPDRVTDDEVHRMIHQNERLMDSITKRKMRFARHVFANRVEI